MPRGAFKVFIGNLDSRTSASELRLLFKEFGNVVACEVVRNFGFVHMENEQQGHVAIEKLHGSTYNRKILKVEKAKNQYVTNRCTTKIYVGNLSENTGKEEVLQLFQCYGHVVELDIVHNYGFVHLDCGNDAVDVVRQLNGRIIDGHAIKVEQSISQVRPRPDMGEPDQCYRCGRSGHWSRDCYRYNGQFGFFAWRNIPILQNPLLLNGATGRPTVPLQYKRTNQNLCDPTISGNIEEFGTKTLPTATVRHVLPQRFFGVM